MKNETENKTAAVAEKNQRKLAELMRNTVGLSNKSVCEFAWQNESDMKHSAKVLESEIENALVSLTQALHYLRNDEAYAINTLGVLQRTNDAIDREVVKMEQMRKTRSFYKTVLTK